MGISHARTSAFQILRAVDGGKYASDLLREVTAGLAPADAGLAGKLVFGVLRYQRQLDYLIEHYSGRRAGLLDPEVRLALRLGIYQLRYLDRIPPHAAVSESVELVKRAGKASAAGLVNAVLRKVDRKVMRWPNREVEFSTPKWLLDNWRRMFGEEAARHIAFAFLLEPVTYIRVPPGSGPASAGAKLEATGVPGCYALLAGNPPGFRRQDINSQSIVPLLDLQPGHRYLDLCAAPGNKTAQALETPVRGVACDISARRLEGMRNLAIPLVRLDGTRELPFRRCFDRILVDAPCSGTGTIGRNPEIKWRIQPSDLERHHQRQVRLLENALAVLALGGRLVYSTCSLEYEENEQVVEEVLDRQAPDVIVEDQIQRMPGLDPGDGFYAAVITR